MKTKLLITCIGFLITGISAHAQAPRTWAMARGGGAFNGGTIVSTDYNGNYQLEYSFLPPHGFHPMGSLLQASDGNLYGTCFDGGSFASCTVFRYDPDNQVYTDVYDFDIVHGDFPTSGLIEVNGILYGASSSGGAHGGGVIYSYNLSTGVYTDLHDLFSGNNEGISPNGKLMLHSNGKLYGMTTSGGLGNTGVIYSFNIATNTYTTEFNFYSAAGIAPFGHLIESNGLLYGMTSEGGATNKGVIFQFDPTNGNYLILHNFIGTDGEEPHGSLFKSTGGIFYGMTTFGGLSNAGVLFSFDPALNDFSKLYDFDVTHGSHPLSDLDEDNAGWLLGTASAGGLYNNGVAFSFNLSNNWFDDMIDFDGTVFGSAPNGGFTEVNTATGIQENANQLQLNFYPNPVKDNITITLQPEPKQNSILSIKDVTGRLITTFNYPANQGKAVKINISKLNSGIYFLETTLNGKNIIQKIVKE